MDKPTETLEHIKRKFNSLNDVPMDQAVIKKVDMEEIMSYISYLESEVEAYLQELILIEKEGYR